MHRRLLTMLSWHTLCITNELLTMSHPVTLPLNTLIPKQLREDVRMDFGGIMLIQISLPKDLEEFSPETKPTGCCFLLYPLPPPLLQFVGNFCSCSITCERPLWSENISECSLVADKKTQELWSCKEGKWSWGWCLFYFIFSFLPNKAF